MASNVPVTDAGAEQIIHPRPSSIVAALYTLRDLETDAVIMHGPSGCCFKHSRLLEEDGIRVVTTAMDETNFVFGEMKFSRKSSGVLWSFSIRAFWELSAPARV